jgi:hypothetical protein
MAKALGGRDTQRLNRRRNNVLRVVLLGQVNLNLLAVLVSNSLLAVLSHARMTLQIALEVLLVEAQRVVIRPVQFIDTDLSSERERERETRL